ncbi:MAG: hypothetical protein AAF771_11590 [Pseudomonadota bacterium]
MLRLIFKTALLAIAASIGCGAVMTNAAPTFGADIEAGRLGGSGYLAARIVQIGDDPRGLQFDLELTEANEAAEARAALHLFALGAQGLRYGAFVLASDLAERTFAAAGPEVLLPLRTDTLAELRAGLGGMAGAGPDIVFAEISLRHTFASGLFSEVGGVLADVDDPVRSGTARQARLGLSYAIPGAPVGVFAELSEARFDGHDDTTLRIGLSIALGADRTGLFRTPRPIAALAR